VPSEVTSAQELQRMTHEQRRAHFDASVVADPEHDEDPRVRALLSGHATGRSDAWRTARPRTPTVSDRRQVVVTDEVFYLIDAALPQAPRRGVPSRAQFISADLLEAVERFATGWDELPQLIAGRDDYRVLISRGRLVHALCRGGPTRRRRHHRAPCVGWTRRSPQ
jgi:hypothetical protein